MDISIFLARFWGSLFMLLGLSSATAGLLKRVIKYTDDKSITVSTGYITFLLGLATVILHNVWIWNWKIAITLLGWATLLKGITKTVFPGEINKKAQLFKKQSALWGWVIFAMGAWFFWMSFQ